MVKLKITLIRSPSLDMYGPEEDKVLGIFDKVQLTYDLLRVNGRTNIGVFDDEKGAWLLWDSQSVPHDLRNTGWSDIYIEPIQVSE